jgi:hypothetical protein
MRSSNSSTGKCSGCGRTAISSGSSCLARPGQCPGQPHGYCPAAERNRGENSPFKAQRGLSSGEVKSLAQCVGTLGFVLAFVRPGVLGQNRIDARKTANLIAKLLVRGL